MKPYMEDGFMVHANTNLPGLKSKVMSKQVGDTRHFYHLVWDELTAGIKGVPENENDQSAAVADFATKFCDAGSYLRYHSTDDRSLDDYLRAHHSAIDLWMALYMKEAEIATVERAGELAAENEDNYSRRGIS